MPVLVNEPLPVTGAAKVTGSAWLKVKFAPLESTTPLVPPIEAPLPPLPTESVPPLTVVPPV